MKAPAEISQGSSKLGQQTSAHSNDNHCDSIVDASDDTSNGLSILAHEVHSDGTTIDLKGQQSNIFQSKCKTRYASQLLMVVVLLMPLVQIWCMLYPCLLGDFLHLAICNG